MTADRSALNRYLNPYRLAAYALVLYAIGHTLGAVVGTPDFGAESLRVVTAMKTVHVAAHGADCTWYGFYRGFGIFVTLFFAFSVVMTWHVGGKALEQRAVFLPVSWALFVSYAISIATAVLFFFPVPIFSCLVSVLLGVACVGDQRALRAASAA